jgi:hypothetical protein
VCRHHHQCGYDPRESTSKAQHPTRIAMSRAMVIARADVLPARS